MLERTMGKKMPAEEVDPPYLPLGMYLGPWRVTGFRGRGAYGTLYRVARKRSRPSCCPRGRQPTAAPRPWRSSTPSSAVSVRPATY